MKRSEETVFLLLETIHPAAQERLESAGRIVLAEDAKAALEACRTEPFSAILTRGRGRVTEELLELCADLRAVARVGVGLDNIDVAAARRRGIRVINAPGSTTIAAAEHTMVLMGALTRRIVPMTNAVRHGEWDVRRDYDGDDLNGKTLGIVGMGAIGQRVGRLADAFGMNVIYWNRTKKDVPYPRRDLDTLLVKSDIVSISVALAPETRGLLGSRELALMKRGSLLINTARGAIVDQKALVSALAEGQLGGFAADVLTDEPPADAEPLLQFDNVLVTPHVAALTESTYRKMCLRTVNDVLNEVLT